MTNEIILTKDQEVAYSGLINFMTAPFNESDYKRALIGAAGSGKTFLIRSLIKDCSIAYSQIGLSAPTHKATRVLQENVKEITPHTLQSDLGLRLNFNVEDFDYNNPPFDPKGKIKIQNYKIYIVDEASMINKSLCMFLENICKQMKCKLIYIGDGSQLAPVKETKSFAFNSTKSFKLTQIVRQGENNPISEILEILRNDIEHKTFKFLEYITKHPYKYNSDGTKGYSVMNKQDFKQLISTKFSDTEFKNDTSFTKVIAYTNICVSNWNKFIRNSIIPESNKCIITKDDLFISYVTIVNTFNECIIKNSEEYIVHDIVNYVHPTYNIKGFMVRFTSLYGGAITQPLFILDHSDRTSLLNYVNTSKALIDDAIKAKNINKTNKWKTYYDFKESCLLLINIANNFGKILYPRNLDYGFSMTSHKSQGSTFDTVFVDVNDMLFDKNGVRYTNVEEINRRLYVACSRAKNNLYLQYGI